MTTHWYAPPPPTTASMDMRLEATPLPNVLLNTQFPPLRAISIPIARLAVRVRSFTFPESPLTQSAVAPAPVVQATAVTDGTNSPKVSLLSLGEGIVKAVGRTRIKPPGDVIKLVDRLQYVL